MEKGKEKNMENHKELEISENRFKEIMSDVFNKKHSYEDVSVQIEDQIKYSNQDIAQFSALEILISTNRRKKQAILLVIFISILLIATCCVYGFSNYNLKNHLLVYRPLNMEWILFLMIPIALLVNCFVSKKLHQLAYKQVISGRTFVIKIINEELGADALNRPYLSKFTKPTTSFKKKAEHIVAAILSPDAHFAKKYKSELIQTLLDKDQTDIFISQWSTIRIERKSFIEYSNWLNIILTVILFVFVSLFNIIAIINRGDMIEFSTIINGEIVNILSLLLIYKFLLVMLLVRLISRGIEIVTAFYKDVVQVNARLFEKGQESNVEYFYYNGFNASLIRQNGRLSLAVHTLIEMMLLFAMIYYLFFSIFYEPAKPGFPPDLFETLFMSTSLGVFNISFGFYQNPILAFVHVSQVIISCVLILLSIAQYLGASRFVTKSEHDLYMKYARIRNAFITQCGNNKKLEKKDELMNAIKNIL